MAAQTKTQRQAAAKKAAATRKQNSARQSGGTAKASARRTRSSAQDTGRRAHDRQAGRQRNRTSRRGRDDAPGAVAHQAERAVLIPVGATLEARDRVTDVSHLHRHPANSPGAESIRATGCQGARAYAPHSRASGLANVKAASGSANDVRALEPQVSSPRHRARERPGETRASLTYGIGLRSA